VVTPAPAVVVVPVEKLWPKSTIVCLGTGPSLTQADVDFCRGKARVIAVNNAHEIAPWADVLYAADAKWWRRFNGVPAFRGLKYSILPNSSQRNFRPEFPDIRLLGNTGMRGLERDPSALRTGCNSGYQAINLAVHLGATQIVLLGYDMHGDHYFGSHPDKAKPPFALCLSAFPTLVAPLAEIGVSIVNCTPGSALTCFPMAPLSSVLEEVAA
jgi:hypothetical protein